MLPVVPPHMVTRWAKDVSQTLPLPEYPRPQMARRTWLNLNGVWSFGVSAKEASQPPADMGGKILVPYAFESVLSGSSKPSIPNGKLWYRRTFTVPEVWKSNRILLHFGAVNYTSEVLVNGHSVGTHRGGYDAFSFDVTDALKPGENEVVVSAINPLKSDVADAQVLGKQRLHPESIFYTAATGIWQTVWLEPVPDAHIESLKMTPDIDGGKLVLAVQSSQERPIKVVVSFNNQPVAEVKGQSNHGIDLSIPGAHLWSPDSPNLYSLKVEMGTDRVSSYFAMRKISLGKDAEGRNRIFLNNHFVFQIGALDQGYWPDGIYTAPTDAALKWDITTAKKLGFNVLRKHAKVEPARWYYHADKEGMLVWQDMPQMFGGENDALTDDAKAQFEVEWRRIIAQHYNSPSIVIWTPFNEGWGQHDTAEVAALTKKLDPSRLVNSVSGWTDKGVGDMRDTHDYPGPGAEVPSGDRASVNGEFGGVTLSLPKHRWSSKGVMGYGATLVSNWEATRNYQALLKHAYELKDSKGVSAFIYTQLTDVELEINGMVTYDRWVTKLDPKIVAAANRGEFPEMKVKPLKKSR